MNRVNSGVSITPSIVDHVARLARLELSPDERERLVHELAAILEHLAKLNELSTDGVEPTSHVIPMTNVLRDDIVETSLPREAVLAAAPEHDDGFFKVPPIIETEQES